MSSGVLTAPAGGVDARRVVFVAACLAVFMVSVEATIVATAIPTIVGDLGGLRLFTWVFGIYFLTQAVGIPIYGRLADIYGRKNLLVIAVTLFLIGSILSGFAHNMVTLIVYRGLQGLGGGGVQPLASTIVGDLYTGQERARVQGYLSSVWGISAVSGPLLGAFIVAHIGWPAIFWVNVPFGILCAAIVLRYFKERIERRSHRIDYAGSILLAGGTGALMFVLVMAGNLPVITATLLSIAAAALIAALIAHELRTAEPMLPLYLYRIRVIAVANSANFAMGALAMGITAFLPTYVQGAMGLSAISAGATLGVMSAAWTVGAVLGSRLLAFATYRVTALAGGAQLIIGSAFLIGLQPGSGIWWAIAGAALIGLGFGYANLVFIVTTQAAVGWEQRGAATASNLFMRQLGQAIGTAAFGAVFNLGLYARIPDASDVVTRMMEPAKRAQLSAFDVHDYAAAIASSLHGIYIILGILGVIVFVLTLALPKNMRPGDVQAAS
jgi:EmrB/QacA subfamily drug resistance transporter